MKFLVAYNGSEAAKRALEQARIHAGVFGASVYVLTSMEGGKGESPEEIRRAEENLQFARNFLAQNGIDCQVGQLARGLTPGEDLIQFAEENEIDHIFVGIEKRSKTRKLLLGSTAQYVILKSKCPVTTTV